MSDSKDAPVGPKTLAVLTAMFSRGMAERTTGTERERWLREEDHAVRNAAKRARRRAKGKC